MMKFNFIIFLCFQNLEEKHALRVQLETKVDDLWQQFRQALQNYNDTNEERKTTFETLKVKDEKSAKEIELQMRKLQRISVCCFFAVIFLSIPCHPL